MSIGPVRRSPGSGFVKPHPAPLTVPPSTGTATASSIPLIWGFSDPKAPDYKIEYKKHADSTWTTFEHESLDYDNEIEVTGLDAATEYDFRVSAVNAHGASAPSEVVSETTEAGE